MKAFVTHDKSGKISSIGLPNAELGGKIGLKPMSTREMVSTVEISGTEESVNLQKYLQTHRVEVQSGRARLVSKQKRKGK